MHLVELAKEKQQHYTTTQETCGGTVYNIHVRTLHDEFLGDVCHHLQFSQAQLGTARCNLNAQDCHTVKKPQLPTKTQAHCDSQSQYSTRPSPSFKLHVYSFLLILGCEATCKCTNYNVQITMYKLQCKKLQCIQVGRIARGQVTTTIDPPLQS